MPAIEHLSIAPQRPQMGGSSPTAFRVRFAYRERHGLVVSGPAAFGIRDC
jgi:hypothetical protein